MPRHGANLDYCVERLTEDQRACLRGVLAHQTSKEMARELGISPHTVDARIRAAIKLLNVETRREAALILEKFECQSGHRSLIYQPLSLRDAPFPRHGMDIKEALADEVLYPILDETEGERRSHYLNDGNASTWGVAEQEGRQSISWPPGQNQLCTSRRLLVIIAISVSSAGFVAMIIIALQALETALF